MWASSSRYCSFQYRSDWSFRPYWVLCYNVRTLPTVRHYSPWWVISGICLMNMLSDVTINQVPGVNIPLHDFGYYIFALILASAFHEAGHALAAARYDIDFLVLNSSFYNSISFVMCLCQSKSSTTRLWAVFVRRRAGSVRWASNRRFFKPYSAT